MDCIIKVLTLFLRFENNFNIDAHQTNSCTWSIAGNKFALHTFHEIGGEHLYAKADRKK
jgi:hypothetical protein